MLQAAEIDGEQQLEQRLVMGLVEVAGRQHHIGAAGAQGAVDAVEIGQQRLDPADRRLHPMGFGVVGKLLFITRRQIAPLQQFELNRGRQRRVIPNNQQRGSRRMAGYS